jgi:hypothetical protein
MSYIFIFSAFNSFNPINDALAALLGRKQRLKPPAVN